MAKGAPSRLLGSEDPVAPLNVGHGWLTTALGLCSSGQIAAVGPHSFRFRKWHAGIGEANHVVIDLSKFWLPKSSVYTARRLSDSDVLATATVLALDQYLGSVGISKSKHTTATAIVHVLAKVWEWGYLHDIYRPERWTASHFRDLWRELKTGGWPLALQLEYRTRRALLQTRSTDSLFIPSHEKGGLGSVNVPAVQRWVQTNMRGRSLAIARRLILQARQIPADDTECPKYSKSLLVAALGTIQKVARNQPPYAFLIDPETVLGSTAARDGVQAKRTPNLEVATAVTLLDTSMRWIYKYSESILCLVRESHKTTRESYGLRPKARIKNYQLAHDYHSAKKAVEDEIGITVRSLHDGGSGGTSLHQLVGMLISAAFIILAVMNARRRDEIRHPKLGLKRDSIREIDRGLGLYEATFYIEKTFKSHATFFVNKSSFDAFQVLVRLNETQLEADRAVGLPVDDLSAACIFWQRPLRMIDGLKPYRAWFNFALADHSVAMSFVRHALGKDADSVKVTAHMFRRFYALIYFYRFEHATLQALAHQLGHLNLGVTQQYVTDTSVMSSAERVPIDLLKSPETLRKAISDDQGELASALDELGREKTVEMIGLLLRGKPYSGGFSRLVQRLHNKLALRVDYSRLDEAVQAKRIATILSQKGHALVPYAHGECMAGDVGKRRSARCYSETLNGLDRSIASASVCAKCSYHVVSIGYLRAQKSDLERLRVEIQTCQKETIRERQLLVAYENLEAAIRLHADRLGGQTKCQD